MQLYCRLLDGKAAGFGPVFETVADFMVIEFADLAAGNANGKSSNAMMVAVVMCLAAGHESINGFELVDSSLRDQPVECAVNLQRRTKPGWAQLVQQGVGGQWRCGCFQGFEHQRLVFRQGHAGVHCISPPIRIGM